MAAIHAKEAINAAAKPEAIKGSNKSEMRKLTFPTIFVGSGPIVAIRHLRINWP
jgi:hypothetical protein